MERKIYNNLAIITSLTIIITSLILSSLFYDMYKAKEIENLKNIATIITDLNLDIENLNIKLDDDISLNLYDSSFLPDKTKSNLYYDLNLNNNTTIRMLKPNKGFNYILISIVPLIASIIVFTLIVLYIVSSLITKNIIGPIKIASKNMENILSGEKVSHKQSYNELDPIIRNMDIYKEEIEYSISQLKDTEKMRREFTANISHELKTPLTSINGFAEMISTGMVKDDDIIKLSTIIHKEGLRLLDLIDSIINLSKLDDLNIQKDFKTINLYSLVNDIFSTLNYRKYEKNLSLRIKGENVVIRANERMIEDVVFNLIDNSIKYNIQNGEVNVEIIDDDKWAVLKISDTGIGIPLEHQNRIFERFYMVDKSRSKKTSGTGLGLSIVKNIVEYHGGNLTLSSIEDKGTTIELKFPK